MTMFLAFHSAPQRRSILIAVAVALLLIGIGVGLAIG
jgi:hypothetical protein